MTEKVKGKRRLHGCVIALLIFLVLLVVSGGVGWWLVNNEHREAASLPIQNVNFDQLSDGTYHGAYAGGMYRWRFNECNVTVTGGRVTDIELVDSIATESESDRAEMLYERVIQAQSLQVDTISGSTLTSMGYLKAVEDALLQAQQ